MTPSERLSLAIHQESAAIAPQTSELIEAAKEALRENEEMRRLLRVIDARDCDRNLFDCPSGGWIRQRIRGALNQQTTPHSPKDRIGSLVGDMDIDPQAPIEGDMDLPHQQLSVNSEDGK